MVVINPDAGIQAITMIIGCVAFAMIFQVRGIQVIYSGIGAMITWFTYLIVFQQTDSLFIATVAGAIFVGEYAFVMARINRAPTTIFLYASVLPLIPGSHLYYMMYCLVRKDLVMAGSEAKLFVLACLGIAVGFLVVEIINKYAALGIGAVKRAIAKA
mgnify:FL=1